MISGRRDRAVAVPIAKEAGLDGNEQAGRCLSGAQEETMEAAGRTEFGADDAAFTAEGSHGRVRGGRRIVGQGRSLSVARRSGAVLRRRFCRPSSRSVRARLSVLQSRILVLALTLALTLHRRHLATAFLGDLLQQHQHQQNVQSHPVDPFAVAPREDLQDIVECIASSTLGSPSSDTDRGYSDSDSDSDASRRFHVRMDFSEHQQDDETALSVDGMELELSSAVLTDPALDPRHPSRHRAVAASAAVDTLPVLPGAHGRTPQISSGPLHCSVLQPGRYVTLSGTQFLTPACSSTARHARQPSWSSSSSAVCWEVCWVKDKPAGTLVCAMDIDRSHQRNAAVLHPGTVYLSFPIWSQQGLEHFGLETKRRLYLRIQECLYRHEQAVDAWQSTDNPILKAFHWHRAEQAIRDLDTVDTRTYESIPETVDDLVELNPSFFLMKKGMIWSKQASSHSPDKQGDLMLGWATLSQM